MSVPPAGGGLAGSLRTLATTLVALLRTRLELLATEVREEKLRVTAVLFYGLVAVSFIVAGLVFLAVFLTVLLWDSHRLLALGVFTAIFLTLGLAALGVALREARSGTRLFAASLAELAHDRDLLDSGR